MSPQSWSSQPDIVHTYRHTTSSAGREKMEKEQKKLVLDREIEEDLRKGAKPEEHSSTLPPYGFYIRNDADPVPGPTEPWVYAMHEPPPLPITPQEAHLYLSPSHMAGRGNHSFAYHAEWDIPRDLLVPDTLCRQCVIDEAQKIITAEDAEGTDPKWTTKRGEVLLNAYVRPEFVTTIHEEPDIYVLREGVELNALVYEGPVRIIRTTVGYQNLARGGYCIHLSEFKHPLRTTVRVTAKLSMQGDVHLIKESRNYQVFPDHFFQHWNGYNVVPPLHEPVPVGALVPQYYGYYTPDEDIPVRKKKRAAVVDEVGQPDVGDIGGGTEPENTAQIKVGNEMDIDGGDQAQNGGNQDRDQSGGDDASMASELAADRKEDEDENEEKIHYRSPIILMENCGSEINIDALNIDDK